MSILGILSVVWYGGLASIASLIDSSSADSYYTPVMDCGLGWSLPRAELSPYVGVDGCRRGWFTATLADKVNVRELGQIWKWPKLLQ